MQLTSSDAPGANGEGRPLNSNEPGVAIAGPFGCMGPRFVMVLKIHQSLNLSSIELMDGLTRRCQDGATPHQVKGERPLSRPLPHLSSDAGLRRANATHRRVG